MWRDSSRNHSRYERLIRRLASIYDGGSRSDVARLGNVTLQIVRDWVMRFNERGPQGLINGKAPGQQSRLSSAKKVRRHTNRIRGLATLLNDENSAMVRN